MFKKLSMILIAGIFILGICRLSFAMQCGEHGSSHQKIVQAHSGHELSAVDVATEAISKKAVNIGNKICPVSGEKIDEKLKVTYEYKGKIYNFCCAMCIDSFKSNPEKYIKKVEDELQKKFGEGEKEENKTIGEGMHEGHQH